MAYSPDVFVDVPPNTTPPAGAPDMDASALNKIGNGVKAAHDDVAALTTRVGTAETTLTGKAATSHSHSGADITSGTVAIARLPTGTTGTTVALGDHTHAGGGGGGAPADHTHDADDLTDGTTNHVFTAADDEKLAGIATGATFNATNAQLRDRATHTGTQAASTITGLAAVATSGSAADLTTGVAAAARLGGGTPSASTILYGDQQWRPVGAVAWTPQTFASSLTINASAGVRRLITATGDLTLQEPSNGANGPLWVRVVASGGQRVVTFAAAIKRPSAIPSTLTIPSGQRGDIALIHESAYGWTVLAAAAA